MAVRREVTSDWNADYDEHAVISSGPEREAAGVKAVLNFSPGALNVPPAVKLKSVDLTVSLESLSFFLAQREAEAG